MLVRSVMRLVDDEIGELLRNELVEVLRDALNCGDDVVRLGFVSASEISPRLDLGPIPLELTLGLGDEVTAMHQPQGAPSEPSRVRDGRHGLACAGRVLHQRDRLPLGPQPREGGQGIVLVLTQSHPLAVASTYQHVREARQEHSLVVSSKDLDVKAPRAYDDGSKKPVGSKL